MSLGKPNPTFGSANISVQPAIATKCKGDAYVTEWILQTLHTTPDLMPPNNVPINDFLGSISGICSDGAVLATVQYSHETDRSCQYLADVSTVLELPEGRVSEAGFTYVSYRCGSPSLV